MTAIYRLMPAGVFVLIVLCVGDSRCFGQVLRYQPSSPAISPYLRLGQFNTTGVPNYYAFVRPLQQQRALNVRQQALSQRQNTEIRSLQNQVQSGLAPTAATGTGSWFMQPGSRVSYLNTSRYYLQAAPAPANQR